MKESDKIRKLLESFEPVYEAVVSRQLKDMVGHLVSLYNTDFSSYMKVAREHVPNVSEQTLVIVWMAINAFEAQRDYNP